MNRARGRTGARGLAFCADAIAMSMKIECVLSCANHLGEGPVWDVDEGCLYWVDGTGRRVGNPSIWRWDPRAGTTTTLVARPRCRRLALRRGGGAVLALADGFYFFDFARRDARSDSTRRRRSTAHPSQRRQVRSTWTLLRRRDGRQGRVEDLRSLAARPRSPRDRRSTTGSSAPMARAGVRTTARSISPTRSRASTWAYDYDIARGALSNKRVFASFAQDAGVADGSTVDAEGCLWNAQLISGDLVRYAPDGTVERRIGMPVRNITSVMFGGDRLDEIFVTSMARVKHPAAHDRFAREARPQFLAGSLFRITGLGIRGVPEPRFAGLTVRLSAETERHSTPRPRRAQGKPENSRRSLRALR